MTPFPLTSNVFAMESIHQRIRRLREQKGLTQDELAAKIGVTRQAVQKWESEGDDRTAPKRARQENLANVLNITVYELMHGGIQQNQHASEPKPNAYLPATNDEVEDGPPLQPRRFPLISWARAGMWKGTSERFRTDEADAWLQCHKDLGHNGYVLRVKGESMTCPSGPYSFPEGMLLYVNPNVEPKPGQFVIVRRKDAEATFKRLTIADGSLFLEAINPQWPNRYISLSEDDHFCGVVVHAGFEMP